MPTRLSKDINSNVLYGLPFGQSSISFSLAPSGTASVQVPPILTTPHVGREVECYFSYNSNGAAVFVALNSGVLTLPGAYVGPTDYDDPAMELTPVIRYAQPLDTIEIVTDAAVIINIVFRAGQ